MVQNDKRNRTSMKIITAYNIIEFEKKDMLPIISNGLDPGLYGYIQIYTTIEGNVVVVNTRSRYTECDRAAVILLSEIQRIQHNLNSNFFRRLFCDSNAFHYIYKTICQRIWFQGSAKIETIDAVCKIFSIPSNYGVNVP